MHYLKGEDILVIHSELIDIIGGLHGVREMGLFFSIVEKPKMRYGGQELYRGIFVKAAVYLESIARYHVFIDGNKRTAIAAAARFLFLNGYELSVSNRGMEQFVLKVVTRALPLRVIAIWLERYSVKIAY